VDEFVRIGRDQGIKKTKPGRSLCALPATGSQGQCHILVLFFSRSRGRGERETHQNKIEIEAQQQTRKLSQVVRTHVASPSTHISGGRAKHTMHTNCKLHHRSLTSPVVERMNTKYKLHHRLLKSPVVEQMNKCCITDHTNLRWSS
jgi:hypothetical protein